MESVRPSIKELLSTFSLTPCWYFRFKLSFRTHPGPPGSSLLKNTVLRMELADLRRSTSGMVPVGRLHPSSSPGREGEPQRACHSVPWGKPPQPQRGPTRPDRPVRANQSDFRDSCSAKTSDHCSPRSGSSTPLVLEVFIFLSSSSSCGSGLRAVYPLLLQLRHGESEN